MTLSSEEATLAAKRMKLLRDSSELFFTKALGVKDIEDYQARVLKTVDENERIAVSACHDVGKTFLAARIVLQFLSTRRGAKAITTAPTFNQVKNILWAELRTAHARSRLKLGGRLNQTEWQLSEDGSWFGLGFTSRNEAGIGEGQHGSSFQGFHAEDLLIVFDEATGIPKAIWDMVEGMLTSGRIKFLCIGNPTSAASEFAKCFKSPFWAKVYLSCFDSPNLIASGMTNKEQLHAEVNHCRSLNDIELRERMKSYPIPRGYLITTKWVVQALMKWGFEHPLSVSKIFGEFPEVTDGLLVTLGQVEESQLRLAHPEPSDRKVLGVDCARFGTDSSVITALHGFKQLARKEYSKRDLVYLTGEVMKASQELGGADVIVVDETGLGGGVVDMLRANQISGLISKDCEIRGVQFGAGVECDSSDPDCAHKECVKARFANIKARMFSLLADDIKNPNGLALLRDESCYVEELPMIKYLYDTKGRLYIESKDEFKKRTKMKSPDNADSLALANFGRYDSISVGRMTKEINSDIDRPLAESLGSERNW